MHLFLAFRFTFYQLGNTVNDTQQIMFSIFLAILLLPALLNASIPKHFILKSLWQARESHSTYSWVAWMTAVLLNELPYAVLQTLIYWPLSYWPVGFPFGEPAGMLQLLSNFTHLLIDRILCRPHVPQHSASQLVHCYIRSLDVCSVT